EAGFDRALTGHAVQHDEYRALAVGLDERDARNLQCLGLALEHDPEPREHAGAKLTARVGYFDGGFEGRGLRVDGRRDEGDAREEGLARHGVDLYGGGLARLQSFELALGDEDLRFERRG